MPKTQSRVSLCLAALDGIPDKALEVGAVQMLIQAAREIVERLLDNDDGRPVPSAALVRAEAALNELDDWTDESNDETPNQQTRATFADSLFPESSDGGAL